MKLPIFITRNMNIHNISQQQFKASLQVRNQNYSTQKEGVLQHVFIQFEMVHLQPQVEQNETSLACRVAL